MTLIFDTTGFPTQNEISIAIALSRGDQIPQSTIVSAKNGWLRILPYNIYTVVLTFPVIESLEIL